MIKSKSRLAETASLYRETRMRPDAETVAEIRAMLAAGKMPSFIADKTGTTPSVVYCIHRGIA